MNSNNNISIIVPVYNVDRYITECLNSIVKQTQQPHEVIIVNDGSTDKSPEICRHFCEIYPFFKMVNQENRGLSSARNKGIDLATGKFICFIDSDDFISDNMLSILLDKILETDAEMVKCGILQYYNESRIDKYCGIDGGTLILDNKKDFFEALFKKRFTHSACNALYKRELFENLRFAEGKVAEDLFIVPHLLVKCSRMVIVSEWLYYYRKRDGSIMQSFDFKHYDILKSGLQMKDVLEQHGLFDSLAEDYFSWLSSHLSALLKNTARHTSLFQNRKHLKEMYKIVSQNDINRVLSAKKRKIEYSDLTREENIKACKEYNIIKSVLSKPNRYWLRVWYNDIIKKYKKS